VARGQRFFWIWRIEHRARRAPRDIDREHRLVAVERMLWPSVVVDRERLHVIELGWLHGELYVHPGDQPPVGRDLDHRTDQVRARPDICHGPHPVAVVMAERRLRRRRGIGDQPIDDDGLRLATEQFHLVPPRIAWQASLPAIGASPRL
jgi:hypothetical protein